MIWPAEVDAALAALRVARDRVGEAVDELHRLRATAALVAPFVQSHDAVSWSIERVSDTISTRSRAGIDAETVEERHVDAQIFPWVEDDR